MSSSNTGNVQSVYHYYFYNPFGGYGYGGGGMSGGMIAGIVIASVGGVIFVSVIIFLVVRVCRQKAQEQQAAEQAAEQVRVTYPQPAQATQNFGNGGYEVQPMGGGGNGGGFAEAVAPPLAVQPAIVPLGVPGTNPLAPNGTTCVYGTPMNVVPPPQYTNEYGSGVYYQRAPGAVMEAGTSTPAAIPSPAPAPTHNTGNPPTNSVEGNVYCFKNWD